MTGGIGTPEREAIWEVFGHPDVIVLWALHALKRVDVAERTFHDMPGWSRPMHETTLIETEQQKAYPGLRVRRDGDAVVVHIPMRFYRRNGRNMIIAEGDAVAVPTRPTSTSANQTLVEAIAKGHLWQQQLESGEYASLDDLAQAVGRCRLRCRCRSYSLQPKAYSLLFCEAEEGSAGEVERAEGEVGVGASVVK